MKSILPFLLLAAFVTAQENNTYSRTYSDAITHLTINSDNTFIISQPDPVFTDSGMCFESKGIWKGEGKDIVLNPHLEKRVPFVSLSEKYLPDADSVLVKINYSIILYKDERLTDSVSSHLQQFTLYLNKEANYLSLVDSKFEHPHCLFGSKIRNAYPIDSIAIARFAIPEKVNKIGIKTYGFENYIELIPKDSASNYFEITIIQPVDSDRRPRSKKVRVNKREAYYYERAGSFNWLAPLYLKK